MATGRIPVEVFLDNSLDIVDVRDGIISRSYTTSGNQQYEKKITPNSNMAVQIIKKKWTHQIT